MPQGGFSISSAATQTKHCKIEIIPFPEFKWWMWIQKKDELCLRTEFILFSVQLSCRHAMPILLVSWFSLLPPVLLFSLADSSQILRAFHVVILPACRFTFVPESRGGVQRVHFRVYSLYSSEVLGMSCVNNTLPRFLGNLFQSTAQVIPSRFLANCVDVGSCSTNLSMCR